MYPKIHTSSSAPTGVHQVVTTVSSNKQQQQLLQPPTFVIQSSKLPVYVQQQQQQQQSMESSNNNSNAILMKIKEEPESPTVRNNLPLPATPKSNETQATDAEGNEQYEGDNNDEEENKKFVLAPTPAQLGKAPLQRRQNQCKLL
jgi:hypothetical protein